MVGADRHHIAHPPLVDAPAQLTSAVHFIARHEGGADPGSVGVIQQGAGQLRLGREQHFFRDVGQLAVLLVGGAAFGQIQGAADQRVPAPGGIGQGDHDLAQRDTTDGAAVLAGRAGAVG